MFWIGQFAFWPFGKEVVNREQVNGQPDIGNRALGTLGKMVWFILQGWLAGTYLLSAVACSSSLV